MRKRFLCAFIIVVFICIPVFGAEDFEFGPFMYICDLGQIEEMPNGLDEENLALKLSKELIRVKAKENFDYLVFDILTTNAVDTEFVLSDSINNSEVIFRLSESGAIYDSGGVIAASFDEGVWHNFVFAFDESKGIYVYFDNALLTIFESSDKMLGLNSAGFLQGDFYFDNVEFSKLKAPKIKNVINQEPETGLSQVRIEFNVPIVIDGYVTKSYIYSPSSPMEKWQTSKITLANACDLLGNELHLTHTVVAGDRPRMYFVDDIRISEAYVDVYIKVFNPFSHDVNSDVYVCFFDNSKLIGVNSFSGNCFCTGISQQLFNMAIPRDYDELILKVFVWDKGSLKPFSKDSYIGIFETVINI